MDKMAPVSSATRIAGAADLTSKPPVAKATLPAVGSEERNSVPDHPASIATFVDAIIAQGPPINLEKITRVRAEIARGTFAADPVGIADAMLNLRVRGQ